jgi:ribosomal protein L16/L10AE
MGKGTGKLAGWVGQISTGVNLFEFKNLRPGRAIYFCNQVRFRLPVKTEISFFTQKYTYLP